MTIIFARKINRFIFLKKTSYFLSEGGTEVTKMTLTYLHLCLHGTLIKGKKPGKTLKERRFSEKSLHLFSMSILINSTTVLCLRLSFILRHFPTDNLLHTEFGLSTRYGLDGPGIESRWGRGIPHPFRQALGPTQSPIQHVEGLFPETKAAGVWR
jgi:hypothetical protein